MERMAAPLRTAQAKRRHLPLRRLLRWLIDDYGNLHLRPGLTRQPEGQSYEPGNQRYATKLREGLGLAVFAGLSAQLRLIPTVQEA